MTDRPRSAKQWPVSFMAGYVYFDSKKSFFYTITAKKYTVLQGHGENNILKLNLKKIILHSHAQPLGASYSLFVRVSLRVYPMML